jgi:putative ATPase
MKESGYGQGYEYAHDAPDAVTGMTCLPDALRERVYYRPTSRGFEAEIQRRLDAWRRRRRKDPPA